MSKLSDYLRPAAGELSLPGEIKKFRAGYVPAGFTEMAASYSEVPAGARFPLSQPAATAGTSAVAAVGGVLYLVTRAQIFKYYPATNVWGLLLNTGLTQWSENGYAAALPDGTLLFGGGTYSARFTATAYIYSPSTNTVSQTTSAPVGMSGGADAIELPGGAVVVATGYTSAAEATTAAVINTNKLYIRAATGVWSTLTLQSSPFGATTALTTAGRSSALCVAPSGALLMCNNVQVLSAAAAMASVNLATGAVTPLAVGRAVGNNGGMYNFVPTPTGAQIFCGNLVTSYIEASSAFVQLASAPFDSTALAAGYTKGRAFFITDKTYVLFTSASASVSAAVVPVAVFNGFPQLASVEAAGPVA